MEAGKLAVTDDGSTDAGGVDCSRGDVVAIE